MLYVMLLALLALLTVVVYLSLGWLVDLLACWCCWLRCTSVSCVCSSVCVFVCLCMVGSPACSLPITTRQSVSQLVGLYAACLTAVCSHHDSAVFVCLSVCLSAHPAADGAALPLRLTPANYRHPSCMPPSRDVTWLFVFDGLVQLPSTLDCSYRTNTNDLHTHVPELRYSRRGFGASFAAFYFSTQNQTHPHTQRPRREPQRHLHKIKAFVRTLEKPTAQHNKDV